METYCLLFRGDTMSYHHVPISVGGVHFQHTLCSHEMMFGNYVKILLVAPMAATDKTAIDCAYNFTVINSGYANFDILNFKSSFNYFFKIQHLYAHFILYEKR
jgi:hypothetical protein